MARLTWLLFVHFLPGCVAFGYPSLTYTPEVTNLPPDVRAFQSTFEREGMSIIMTGGETIRLIVEEIPIRDGRLDSQDEAYFAYDVGCFAVGFMHKRDWSICLYRAGYEVIEIQSRWCGGKLLD